MVSRRGEKSRLTACGLLFLLLLGGAWPSAAQEDPAAQEAPAKEFHWSRIEVAAKLEADGSIRVQERQHYVFTGDYNGGQRGFDLRMRQRLDFQGISRETPEGWKPLAEGDLAAVDHYEWSGDNLRWRSRLPEDPPFDHSELVYQLDYRITNVVVPAGESFRLAHDFLFPDREAVVEQLTVDLEIDPAWQVRGDWQRHHTAGPLQPGQGYVVRLDLGWEGAGEAPVYRAKRPFLPLLLLLLLGIAGGMAFLLRRFLARQGALGRFRQAPPLPAGGEARWLEQNLLPLRAEEVGALWDRTIGPPEVAALIARWVAEGKARSRVEETAGFLGLGKERILHLELVDADRDEFPGYEGKLISKLFFGGRTATDTKSIREYYKGAGFDPAGTLREGLAGRLESHPGWQEKASPAAAKKPTLLLFLAGLACLALDFFANVEGAFLSGFFYFFPLIPVYIIAGITAAVWRKRVQKVFRGLFWISLLPAGYLLWLGLFVANSPIALDESFEWSPGYFALVGYGLMLLGIYRSVLNIASSREAPEGVALRQWLARARNYLAEELRREKPEFSDAMFPYLLAFGLDRDVDRWFRSFAVASQTFDHRTLPAGGGSSGGGFSGSSGGGFTGGGGLFGGGGASASWAAAATSVAAGVAAPSSSSSGGGSSGGGGSSSGGGSGGAW